MNPQQYSQLNIDKAGKNIQWEKKHCSTNTPEEKLTVTCKINESDHFPTLHTTLNSKWIKELNVRQEKIKILERTQAVTSLI